MYILIVEHFKGKLLKQGVAKWISDSSLNEAYMNLSKVLQSCLERWYRRNNRIHIVYEFLVLLMI
jgi:hypothetical protein